jgi:uncharacterized protein
VSEKRAPRALLDTSVLVAYLLQGARGSAVAEVIDAAHRREFVVLLPAEFRATLAAKRYLAERITSQEAEQFIAAAAAVAELVPPIEPPIPAATRDPKDDYLLAYALVGAADYLVTGDRDLLALGQVGGLRIVSPADFLRILEG